MNKIEFSDASEKLSAMLDGELPKEELSPLFMKLASDYELQDEFSGHLEMKKMFSNATSNPPSYLRKKVLIGTGLGTATGLAATAIGNPLIKLFTGLGFSKMWVPGISALIGSILTASVFWFGSSDSENLNGEMAGMNDMSFSSSSSLTFVISSPPEQPKVPVVQSYNNNTSVSISRNYNTEQILVDKIKESMADSETSEGFLPEIEFFIPIADENLLSGLNSDDIISFEKIPKAKYSMLNPIIDINKFALSVRGFSTRSIPQFSLDPYDSPIMNNMGLALFYRIDPSHSVGFEFGQEGFLQKYDGRSNDGIPMEIKQNYIAAWFGIVYQYNISGIKGLDDITPYTRLFLGGTKVGPLMKGTIGLQYTIEDKVSFYGGIEPTLLIYNFQGQNFTTTKIGFTYGMSVNF